MIAPDTVLEDDLVCLRPLRLEDSDLLWEVAQEPEIWRYMRAGLIDTPTKMLAWTQSALEACRRGTDFPFVTIDKSTGRLAGSTRYMTLDAPNRSLEIGGTWLGGPFRRSPVNTHAKYLMLSHAFDALSCIRVQLRTDSRNLRSQKAIERIGAQREGTFRRDFIYPDGYRRDTIFYSVIAEEWPATKQHLERLLDRSSA